MQILETHKLIRSCWKFGTCWEKSMNVLHFQSCWWMDQKVGAICKKLCQSLDYLNIFKNLTIYVSLTLVKFTCGCVDLPVVCEEFTLKNLPKSGHFGKPPKCPKIWASKQEFGNVDPS